MIRSAEQKLYRQWWEVVGVGPAPPEEAAANAAPTVTAPATIPASAIVLSPLVPPAPAPDAAAAVPPAVVDDPVEVFAAERVPWASDGD